MTIEQPIPTLEEQMARAAANPDGPQPTKIFALAEELGRIMARQVQYNLKRYPDIVDGNDPRLAEPVPAPAPPPPAPQWVYFMADGVSGLIKVGTSVEVKVRLATVARGMGRKVALVGSVRGDYATETAFHKLLTAHRAHGEWFRRGPWFDQILTGLDARENAEALIARLTTLEARNG